MQAILLIEPDPVLARRYVTLLEQGIEGEVRVDRVARAQTALSRLDDTQYAAIILELQLGPHNGLEFLYEIRSYQDLRTVPVIIHSTVDTEPLVSSPSFKHLGIYRYIRKPARDPKQFLHVVQSCVDEQLGKKVAEA